jgi:hypothetical protein
LFPKLRPPLGCEGDVRLLLNAGEFEREFTLPDVRLLAEPAHGGRSECADDADWLVPFGRFDDALPNPCGARPRSVAFPCADQFRVPLFAGRLAEALLFTDARPFTPAPAFAEGGLLLLSSRCREDIAPVLAEVPALLRAPKPALFPPRLIPPFAPLFATCPADKERVSIVCTGM